MKGMMEKWDNPPRLVTAFLRWFCKSELLEDVEGDLTELFLQRSRESKRIASLEYFRDVLLLFRPGIIKNLTFNYSIIHSGMIKNYFKSAYRNLIKYKGFSTINILSLSIGMAACLVVFLFVQDEQSFDANHQNNIYRLCEVQNFPGTNTQKVALSMPGMAPTMTQEFPEIETYTRYWGWGRQLVERPDKKIIVEHVAGVDSTFFDVFDFKLTSGSPGSVLNAPFDAVVTKETAIKLFGSQDAIGETFVIQEDQYVVRGIMNDVPENSHLQFDMLLSIYSIGVERAEFDSRFGSNSLNTYFVLNKNADLSQMASKFPEYLTKYVQRDNDKINEYYKLFLQPLHAVHLSSSDIEHDYNNYRKFNGKYINVFLLVGVLSLIIATINFTNLTTARANTRSKEVGLRKAIGARRKNLIEQFILESLILSGFATFLAILIVYFSLPYLNALMERNFSLNPYLSDHTFQFSLLGISIFLGLIAGVYPSLYLSSFKPPLALKGFKSQGKKSYSRSALVIFQFCITLGMIVSSIIVAKQLLFMKNKDIGFSKEHIVLVPLNGEANESYAEMKLELLSKSNILGVSASGQRLGNNFHQWGFKVKMDTGVTRMTPSNVYVDYDFLEVYDIKIKEGRSFSKDYAQDNGLSFIINQSFANELGFESAVGKKVGHSWYPNDSLGTIIGVTEDFNFNSLHYKVNTLSMVIHEDWGFSEMSIKVNGENIPEALDQVERVYGQFVKEYPFEYEFLNDHFNELYQSDQQMGRVVTIITGLSIFIGCMGLFGLASISIQRRTKEIGIRKVLGASIQQLLVILSQDFALMILASAILATPVTYYFMQQWLEGFAYSVQINPLVFVFGGLVSLVIAMVTISFHTIKAANANPVHSLRDE